MLSQLQTLATSADIAYWEAQGLTKDANGLWSKGGVVGIPQIAAPILILQIHGLGHKGLKQTIEEVSKRFCAENLKQVTESMISRCLTCARNNVQGKKIGRHEHLLPPQGPFQELQIDFTHMPKATNGCKILLVIVDRFSRWPEAFVVRKEDAKTVAKILCKEIIPRWGCPVRISSDNGTPFTSKVTQSIAEQLAIDWKFHIPYHPQSAGVVERMNRTLKEKLRKATEGTYHKWDQYLPAILAEVRMTPDPRTKLSPFEILMGRPFPTPWTMSPLILMPGDLQQIQEEYVAKLIEKLNSDYGDISLSFPLPTGAPTHPFKPGDRVLVKSLHKLKSLDPPYGPPVTVQAVTRTAVLTDDSPAWIHASRLKEAPPVESCAQVTGTR